MPYTPEELLKITANYERLTSESLVATAKKKEKKKLDPKAKVRNRGTVCVPAENAKDKKDHFPINDEGQARSALSRVEGLSSAPWYNGSLEGLRALVKRKVHAKFPGIGKDKKKKSSLETIDEMLKVYAQDPWAGQTHPSTGVAPQTRGVAPVSENTSTPTETAEDRYNRLQQTYQAQQPAAKPAAQPAGKPAPDHWVAALQNFLVSQNLLAPTIGGKYQVDGVIGGNTVAALKKWQEAHNPYKAPSGQLDQETIDALNPIIKTYRVDNIVGA